jgi:S-DNA-T family DNA segregation ATPase FtsK/SpoIIIE
MASNDFGQPSNYNPRLDLREYKMPSVEIFESEELKKLFTELQKAAELMELPVLWSSFENKIVIRDLSGLNNLLIVGPPYMGKSVFLQQLLISLIYIKHPSELKLILIDCRGLDLGPFESISSHFLAALPYSKSAVIQDEKSAVHTLRSIIIEMSNRYDLLKDASCKNIHDYNIKFCKRELNPQKGHQYLPYIIIAVDELANLMTSDKKEVVSIFQNLLSLSYKVGILSLIVTNQFLIDSVPSSISSLIQTRVAFNLFDKNNYRHFFDKTDFEKPLKQGDFVYSENDKIISGKTKYIPTTILEIVLNAIQCQASYPDAYLLSEYVVENGKIEDFDSNGRDPLFEEAARLIVFNQIGSTSLIQRRMKLGYNRAVRLIDQLETAGIIGPNKGAKAREVIIKTEAELNVYLIRLRVH